MKDLYKDQLNEVLTSFIYFDLQFYKISYLILKEIGIS